MKKKIFASLMTVIMVTLLFGSVYTYAYTGLSSVNMALGQPVSGTKSDELDLSLVNDGVTTTHPAHSSTTGNTKTIKIELPNVRTLGQISVYMGSSIPNTTITVDYSVDNSTWVNVGTITSADKNKWCYFPLETPADARYIRVYSPHKGAVYFGEIEAYEYGTRELILNTYSHESLSEAAGGTFTSTLTYDNTFVSETYPLLHCLGLYEKADDVYTLKEVCLSEIDVLPVGSGVNVTASLDLSGYTSSELENCIVKAFMWDSSENLKPLKPSVIFPQVFTED